MAISPCPVCQVLPLAPRALERWPDCSKGVTVAGCLLNTLYLKVFQRHHEMCGEPVHSMLALILLLFINIHWICFGVFVSCILLFMLATPGSLLLDECNIACSLNYGAALMRGISQNVDKMNMVPQFLLVYELWEMQHLHGRRYDMPYPCSVLATPARLHSRCLLLLLIFLSGGGNLSDTRAWKGLIKRSYCQRWPYRDATV